MKIAYILLAVMLVLPVTANAAIDGSDTLIGGIVAGFNHYFGQLSAQERADWSCSQFGQCATEEEAQAVGGVVNLGALEVMTKAAQYLACTDGWSVGLAPDGTEGTLAKFRGGVLVGGWYFENGVELPEPLQRNCEV